MKSVLRPQPLSTRYLINGEYSGRTHDHTVNNSEQSKTKERVACNATKILTPQYSSFSRFEFMLMNTQDTI